jgi:hypothetical protein
MRREPEYFEERELVLVHMARRLREALAVEELFDAGGLDYVVEAKPYQSGLLFPFSRVGAFFYVTPEREAHAGDLLKSNGYKTCKK